MAFNQVESMFLAFAISDLEKQLKEIGEIPEDYNLYLGGKYKFVLLGNCKLSILDQKGKPRKDITPANCYNFYRSMCIADAVQEYLDRQKNPQKYLTPFFI